MIYARSCCFFFVNWFYKDLLSKSFQKLAMDDEWWPCEDWWNDLLSSDPTADEKAYAVSLQSLPIEPLHVSWQPMSPDTNLQFFDIYTDGNHDHGDYLNEIRYLYQATFPQVEILRTDTVETFNAKTLLHTRHRLSKITRVQNRVLYQKHKIVKQELQNEEPIFAFHATDEKAIFNIIMEGFDVRRAKNNESGYVTYFSRDMLSAMSYASADRQPNGNVKMHVLVCDVVLGPTATAYDNQIDFGTTLSGQPVMTLVPPIHDPLSWFVIRDTSQALPLYILEVEYIAALTHAHPKKQDVYFLGLSVGAEALQYVSRHSASKRIAGTLGANKDEGQVARMPSNALAAPAIEKIPDNSGHGECTKRLKATSVCTTVDAPKHFDAWDATPPGFNNLTYAHLRWTLFGYDFTRWQRVLVVKPGPDFGWAAQQCGTIYFILNKGLYFVKLDNEDLTRRVCNVNANNLLHASIVDYIQSTSAQIEAI